MRVLFYGESPCIETGLGQVAKQHIQVFQDLGYEIEAVCINHSPDLAYDREKWPFTIHPVRDNMEPYNRENMKDAILRGDYDLIFLSADCGTIQQFDNLIHHMRGQKKFKVVSYVPVDCDVIGPEPFTSMTLSDYTATYTYHGQRVLKRILPGVDVDVIYLGCEPDLFHVIDLTERDEIRHKLFGADENVFIVTMANRNQARKDLARGMYAFHLFHEKYPNSLLYMHAKQNDVGGSLPSYANVFGMHWKKIDPRSGKLEIYFTAENFNECFGIDRVSMNNIYNMADVYISSSTGEGWGLHTSDAMAAGCPVVVPGNTANLDLIGENGERGYLVKCGGPDHWILPYSFTANPRDIISVTDMVAKLEHVLHNRTEAKIKAMHAREWTEQHTWQEFRDKWSAVLSKVCIPMEVLNEA